MRKQIILFFIQAFIITAVCCSGAAHASGPFSDSRARAYVKGIILDETASPVENVLVRMGTYEVMTDDQGLFSYPDITPGKYQLSLNKQGYKNELSELYIQDGENSVELMLFKAPDGTFNSGETRGRVNTSETASEFLLPENAVEQNIRKNAQYSNAVPSLTGMSGLIDLPDARTVKKGENVFGVHYLSMDGVADNADMFTYKWLYGINDNLEASIGLVDTKTGKHVTQQGQENFVAGMKYRIPEEFENFDLAVGGQVSENTDQFFGSFDYFLDQGKMCLILKNNNGDSNLSLNLGMEFDLKDLEKYTRGSSSIIFEAEQYENRFELFNLGLRHRTGKQSSLDLIYMQDRRYDDVQGTKTRRVNSFVVGGSISF
jgi:hypothetical protein